MFDRISYTFSVMGHSWELLKRQKSLAIFPLLSAISCILVVLSFVVPLAASGKLDYLLSEHEKVQAGVNPALAYGVTFAFYFVNYFFIVFFNAALVGCAVRHMSGEETSLRDGLGLALARLPQVFGWALLSATVGMIFHVIENTHEKAGQILTAILGTAWTMMTFLVVPALVVDRMGPLAAVSASTRLLKQTWGQQLVGNFSFGIVFFLLAIPAWLCLVLALAGATHGAAAVALVALAVVYLVVLGCVQSTLQTIFQASLYMFARDGHAPARGIPASVLQGAVGRG